MKERKTRNNRNTAAIMSSLLAAGSLVFAASADVVTNVTITSVAQRWPWNNKVDITYTVQGGQDKSSGVYCGLRFSLSAGGKTYDFEGYTVGASAENGTHTVTWTAPQGIVATDCSLTATLFSTNSPSGNDYMIVDLSNGAVVYEGMMATQPASDDRYNTAAFKTDKLVLRKVPRTAHSATLPNGPFASGYPTGDNVNYASSNSEKKWVLDRDYYIGVFPVTQHQYVKLGLSNPSAHQGAGSGDVVNHRPVERVTYSALRGGAGPTAPIPAVATANSGSFLQRLNYLTGNRFGFDLPTEVMYEIALRAGTTTAYFWEGTASDIGLYCANKDFANCTVAVGSFLPNRWGLFDMVGNVTAIVLDGAGLGNLGNAAKPFVYNSNWNTWMRWRGMSGYYSASELPTDFYSSRRQAGDPAKPNDWVGFRVSMIAD